MLPIQKQLEQNGHTGNYQFQLAMMMYSDGNFSISAAIAAADTGNPASLINGIQTLRQKLGDDPEVLVYNATGFLYSKVENLK